MLISKKKPRYMIILAIIVVIGLTIIIYTHPKAYQTMDEYIASKYPNIITVSQGDYYLPDYLKLKEIAHTIALVTPGDNLTVDNSYMIGEGNDPGYWMHSLRRVKVLEFYKNLRSYTNEITIAETCVKLKNGKVAVKDDAYPMIKGDKYLVFLYDSNYPDKPMVAISNGFGKVDVTHLKLNSNYEIAVKAAVDLLGNELSEDVVNALLKSEVDYDKSKYYSSFLQWEEISIDNSYIDKNMRIDLKYARYNDTRYFALNDNIYVYEGSKW